MSEEIKDTHQVVQCLMVSDWRDFLSLMSKISVEELEYEDVLEYLRSDNSDVRERARLLLVEHFADKLCENLNFGDEENLQELRNYMKSLYGNQHNKAGLLHEAINVEQRQGNLFSESV